ncbi:hypothetical protein PGB90_007863 [Kerria lacca]
MTKPVVFITRNDFPCIMNELLKEKFQVKCWSEKKLTKSQFLENIKGVFGIICSPSNKIDKEILDVAGNTLKVVSTFSVGYDHINVKDVKAYGIRIGHTPDVLTESTAEYGVGLLLTISRRIIESHLSIHKNEWTTDVWTPMYMCGQGLENSVVGIVGCGRIGTSVAKKVKAFNIKRLLYYNRKEKQEVANLGGELKPIDELIRESDFIIVTISLNEETKGIINKERINLMKSNAIFVNIARGAIVDQKALTEVLQNKKIAGAGLDVFETEPIDTNDPLLKLNNVVITAHIASATFHVRNKMAEVAAKNVIAVLENRDMVAEIQ